MPSIFWTGRLSPLLKMMVNFSNVIAWITGNARDTAAMRQRIKNGYNRTVTDDVTRYDEVGIEHYTKISQVLLEKISLRGKTVLDIGCGTGILSFLALQRNAAKVVCGDISEYMLGQCEKKANALGYKSNEIEFRQFEANSLPFGKNTFDIVMSGMVLGLIPNQKDAVAEMIRVLKPGGTIGIATHGPELYFEACETTFKAIPLRLVFGYRVEFWPVQEKEISSMFSKAGLTDILTKRVMWTESFPDGGKAYDFFAATSSAWWYSKFPPDQVASLVRKVRRTFEQKDVKEITSDIVIGYGKKT